MGIRLFALDVGDDGMGKVKRYVRLHAVERRFEFCDIRAKQAMHECIFVAVLVVHGSVPIPPFDAVVVF